MSQHNRLADWLICRAARIAPAALSERLQEEWRADLMTRSSSLSQLRFGFGCCWAIVWIAREQGFATAAAPAAASASGSIAIFREEPGLLSGRSSSLILVILLHSVVFYALFVSLGPTFTKISAPPPLVPRILEPQPPERFPVPTTDPKLPTTALTPERPEVIIPADPKDDSQRMVPRDDVVPFTPASPVDPPVHVVNRVQGGPAAGFPNANDFYPSASIRGVEQGNVSVRVCVDPRGRLTSEPTMVQSSGYPRLDAGALVLAKAGSGHYQATTEDGRAINSCYAFRVVFKLKQ